MVQRSTIFEKQMQTFCVFINNVTNLFYSRDTIIPNQWISQNQYLWLVWWICQWLHIPNHTSLKNWNGIIQYDSYTTGLLLVNSPTSPGVLLNAPNAQPSYTVPSLSTSCAVFLSCSMAINNTWPSYSNYYTTLHLLNFNTYYVRLRSMYYFVK